VKIDGACHCGHISYEAEIDPARVSICHCTDCQALTGSAYRVSIGARREDVRLTGGEPKIYVKTADSGRGRRQYFCPECGSPVFTSTDSETPEHLGIRWGSVRQRNELPPTHRTWVRSSLPWMGHIDELPGRALD
jgi:hypothetical protein